MLFFFFFKQKTAYEMRISDWSSDVCSSDLSAAPGNRTVCNGNRGRDSADLGRRLSQAASGRRKRGLFLPDRKALVRKMTGRRVEMPLGRMSPGVGLRPTPPPLFRPQGIPTRVPTCPALQRSDQPTPAPHP